MVMRTYLHPLPFAATLLLLAGTASANLLQNGSFELGSYDDSAHPGYMRLDAGATDLTGWTVAGPGVDWHVGDPPDAHFGPAADGRYALDLSLDFPTQGSVSQDFATTAGMLYLLSFQLGSPGFDSSVDVHVGDQHQVFTALAGDQYGFPWTPQALTFTAQAGTTTLTFTGGDGGFWGPVIDQVVVVEAPPVPEPAAWALLAAGLGAVGLAARRRRA